MARGRCADISRRVQRGGGGVRWVREVGWGALLFGGNNPLLGHQNSVSSQRQNARGRPMKTLALLPIQTFILLSLSYKDHLSLACGAVFCTPLPLSPPPFFWQDAQKKKEMEIYYINIPYVMANANGVIFRQLH